MQSIAGYKTYIVAAAMAIYAVAKLAGPLS